MKLAHGVRGIRRIGGGYCLTPVSFALLPRGGGRHESECDKETHTNRKSNNQRICKQFDSIRNVLVKRKWYFRYTRILCNVSCAKSNGSVGNNADFVPPRLFLYASLQQRHMDILVKISPKRIIPERGCA